MNTRLNIFRDRKEELTLKSENITLENIKSQSERCDTLFDDWHKCIKSCGWNDQKCVGELKPKYELCVKKIYIMQNLFDEKV